MSDHKESNLRREDEKRSSEGKKSWSSEGNENSDSLRSENREHSIEDVELEKESSKLSSSSEKLYQNTPSNTSEDKAKFEGLTRIENKERKKPSKSQSSERMGLEGIQKPTPLLGEDRSLGRMHSGDFSEELSRRGYDSKERLPHRQTHMVAQQCMEYSGAEKDIVKQEDIAHRAQMLQFRPPSHHTHPSFSFPQPPLPASLTNPNTPSSANSITLTNPIPPSLSSATPNNKRSCNCKHSRCLKLYCECFASGDYCKNCNCIGCCNNMNNENLRKDAINGILERNPSAFRPKISNLQATHGHQEVSAEVPSGKHSKGCACKKSICLKKYCECFQAGIYCSDNCKCIDCKNYDGSIDRRITLESVGKYVNVIPSPVKKAKANFPFHTVGLMDPQSSFRGTIQEFSRENSLSQLTSSGKYNQQPQDPLSKLNPLQMTQINQNKQQNTPKQGNNYNTFGQGNRHSAFSPSSASGEYYAKMIISPHSNNLGDLKKDNNKTAQNGKKERKNNHYFKHSFQNSLGLTPRQPKRVERENFDTVEGDIANQQLSAYDPHQTKLKRTSINYVLLESLFEEIITNDFLNEKNDALIEIMNEKDASEADKLMADESLYVNSRSSSANNKFINKERNVLSFFINIVKQIKQQKHNFAQTKTENQKPPSKNIQDIMRSLDANRITSESNLISENKTNIS